MKSYKTLLQHHLTTGYFSSVNDSRYGYILSPYPFVLCSAMKTQLEEIGKGVKEYLNGIISFMKAYEKSNDHFHTNLRSMILSSMHGLPYVSVSGSVPICKVDIMVGTDGNLRIAEVDAYNPRGIAFASFMKDVHNGYSDHSFFSGVEETLREEMDKRNSKKLVWLYAHHERYYITAFQQLQRILKRKGIDMILHDTEENWNPSLLDDNGVISMIPWGMRTERELINKYFLTSFYNEEPNRFLYPLAPWLGTKAIMGMVSNAGRHRELEDLVHEHFGEIELIRKYIPPTVLLGKKFSETSEPFIKSLNQFVLKAHVASGLKGVWFSDNKISPCSQVNQFMKEKRPNYTVQEYVDQKTFSIPTYSGPRKSLITEEWYIRLTAYVDARGNVIDAEITGRRTPDVHGAPDCIQAPCVF